MSRWLFVLSIAALLSGCALLLPEQKELPPAMPESAQVQQQEFDRYLDDFLAGGDPTALDQYLAGGPDSKQHEAMRRLAHQLRQCHNDHAELTAELASGNQLVTDLEGKNHQLRETIEQLKSLLIQLEQRTH